MLDALAPDVAVLGTTATANDRVVATSSSSSRRAARSRCGSTAVRWPARACASRSSSCRAPPQRLAWLVEHLPALRGLGHRLHADQAGRRAGRRVPHRQRHLGASAYSGEQDSDERVAHGGAPAPQRGQGGRRDERARDGVRQARSDVRRALSGPGVGDRLLPAGRAGRARRWSTPTSCCCAASEDRRIQDFFIEQAFPTRERVAAVLDELEARRRSGAHARAS